jgi:hypothetical protein
MLMAATTAVQAAKKNHPALERNESLRVMGLIRHPRFLFWREAGQSGLAPDYENSLAVSTSGAFHLRYCAGGAGGA